MATTRPASSNVVPLPGTQMPGLGIASTAAKGIRITGSRNEVWLCQAYTSGEQGIMLFVKPALPIRSMMVEALAAQVGQCMGLPCPDPYLVTVNPKHIGQPVGQRILAFGSEQRSRFTRPILDTDMLVELLEKQKLADPLCCFDELIANGVRSPRDVMFDAEHGIAIIDHEGAMELSTRPSDPVTNWIATQILVRITPDQRGLFLKRLRASAAMAQQMPLGVAPSAVQFTQQGIAVYRQLTEFLKERLVHLDGLLSTRVLPEQGHVSQHPQSNESHRTSEL